MMRIPGYTTVLLAALLAPAAARAADAASPFANLVQSRYVHCAFYKQYETNAGGDLVLTEGRSQSLTHFQAIHNGQARQIMTRVAGARNVRVIDNGKYLHFVDHVAGMYILTTIYGCIDRDPRSGTCISYGATQSRHFDPRVLVDADAVYEELKEVASPGFCDHSFIGIQEAKTGDR